MIKRITTIPTVTSGLTSRPGATQDQTVTQEALGPTFGMSATPEWRPPSWIAYMSDGSGPEVSRSEALPRLAKKLFAELVSQNYSDMEVTYLATQLIGEVTGSSSSDSSQRNVRKKAASILAKSIYKELTAQQYSQKQIVSLATDLVSAVVDKKVQSRLNQAQGNSSE
jgi:hypothetical protein